MDLDPFSETLISDWAEQAFGISLTSQDKSKLKEWLRGRETDFQAKRVLLLKTGVPDVLVLGRKAHRNSRRHQRVLELYVSYQNGPFQRLNDLPLDSPDARGNLGALVRNKVIHFQHNLADKRANKIDLPWRFVGNFTAMGYVPVKGGVLKAFAESAFHKSKSVIKAGRHYLSPQSVEKAESSLPILIKMLRRRLRISEAETIRTIVDSFDREALSTMRRLHNFDNRLYAWLVEPGDNKTRKRRRQFAEAFPMVIYQLYQRLPTTGLKCVSELSKLVDDGTPMLEREGLDLLKEIFSLYVDSKDEDKCISEKKISLETARAMVVIRPGRSRESIDLVLDSISLLDQIPPKHWPAFEHLSFIDALKRNMPKNVFRRLVEDTGSDWNGLYHFTVKAVARRYRAIADTENYRAAREAEAKGEEEPKPKPPNEVTADDTNSVALRVRDYINMIIDRVVVPAYFAAGRTLEYKDRNELHEKLFMSASFKQLIEASESWHEPRRRDRLDADLDALGQNDPEFSKRVLPLSWLPLVTDFKIPVGTIFEGQNIGGLSFAELTTPKQLIDEGKKMDHCVGSYSSTCLDPNAVSNHIIHLDGKDGKALSTIHLKQDEQTKKDKIKIAANLSFHDKTPSPHALAAGRWLVKMLTDGKIKTINTAAERQAHRKKVADADYKIEQMIGYNARKPEVLAEAFGLVRQTFPPRWRHCENGFGLIELANGGPMGAGSGQILKIALGGPSVQEPSVGQLTSL